MGDRGQVFMQQGKRPDGSPDGFYIYTHWAGCDLPNAVHAALARKERWDDEEYFARIVFDAIVKHDNGTTGYGIGTDVHGDVEYPVLVIDCQAQKIHRTKAGRGDTPQKSWTFAEFLALQLDADEPWTALGGRR